MNHFHSEPQTKMAHALDQIPMPQTNMPWTNAPCLRAMAQNFHGLLQPKRHILVPLCFSTLFLVIIVFIILSLSHCSSILLFVYYYI